MFIVFLDPLSCQRKTAIFIIQKTTNRVEDLQPSRTLDLKEHKHMKQPLI